ncbi:MAG: YfhO family protein [bacterium]|nr:YfhO family protein [bacterium]
MKKINYKYLFLAFVIPLILMVIVYAISGIYPFGEKTLLTVDMQGQYVSFFSAYKNILGGVTNLFYSFSKTLGGNMYSLFCYYLMSPFNLILLLFDISNFPNAIFIINILKIACAGVTSYIFFSKTFKSRDMVSLIFAIIYSLMAYNVVYSQNIMWLDGVILLPLVFLGVRNLFSYKPWLFYLSLVLAIVTNYYVGYMICIGSLLYYLYELYIDNNYSFKNVKSRVLYFFKYGLLAVGSSMFVLLPSIFTLLSGKVSGSLSEFIPKQTYAFFDLVSRFFLGSFKLTDLEGGSPNLFVSLLVIGLVILYFFNKKITKKDKVITVSLISVFILSFLLYPLDIIWHAFQHPAGFPARYAFIFDFIILIIAYKSYINLDKVNKNNIYKILGFALVLFVFIDKMFYTSNLYYKYFVSFLLLSFYLLYLTFSKKKELGYLICFIVIIEMFSNALLITTSLKYSNYDEYLEFVNSYGTVVELVNTTDTSFYRMEKEKNYSTNDPLLLNYNGISHFSSTYEGKNNELLGDYLGIFNRFYITSYVGSTYATNSLFGIKYIMSEDDDVYYTKLSSYGDIQLYYNNYYLPLGFITNDITNLKLEKYNPFINQNNIFMEMSGITGNIFNENTKVLINYDNVKLNVDGKTYAKIINSTDGFLSYEVTSSYDGIMYAYFASPKNKKVDIKVNGESIIDIADQNSFRYNVLELGYFKVGEVVKIEIELLEDTTRIDDYQFYTLNMQNLSTVVDKLDNSTYKVVINKGDYIGGYVDNTTGGMLYTSIPYDDGWNVYVDSKRVEKSKILDTFIGVSLSSGEHYIEFKYFPKGLLLGILISIASFVLYFLLKKNEVR